MEKEPLNDGTLSHTPGTNDELAIGSYPNTGGRHGAAHKINTGNAGTNSQNGDVVQPAGSSSPNDVDPAAGNKNDADDHPSYNGNNDPDANRTPYAGSANKE